MGREEKREGERLFAQVNIFTLLSSEEPIVAKCVWTYQRTQGHPRTRQLQTKRATAWLVLLRRLRVDVDDDVLKTRDDTNDSEDNNIDHNDNCSSDSKTGNFATTTIDNLPAGLDTYTAYPKHLQD